MKIYMGCLNTTDLGICNTPSRQGTIQSRHHSPKHSWDCTPTHAKKEVLVDYLQPHALLLQPHPNLLFQLLGLKTLQFQQKQNREFSGIVLTQYNNSSLEKGQFPFHPPPPFPVNIQNRPRKIISPHIIPFFPLCFRPSHPQPVKLLNNRF